jgi:two-component system, NarL family, nitrate/nitrite sensor histidine kinase NarX
MSHPRHWSLGIKLALVGTPFLLAALLIIAVTLWVSWQLEGGAAAVNEAGRMRMQANRLSLSIATNDLKALPGQRAEFERSLDLLRDGDPERPLFVPWDDAVRQDFAVIERDWTRFRGQWIPAQSDSMEALRADVAAFTAHIDGLVAAIETHMSRWTALLHLLQVAMMTLAVIGAAAILYTGYMFVLEPVGQLKEATERIQRGDFGARVQRITSDEFGTLAKGFNGMAEHLQSMYRNLEGKVAEKTSELQEKRERLEALYDVTTLVAKATTLNELATGFARHVGRVARADGVALRWSDETNQRFLLLASEGLPAAMTDGEQCIKAGDCFCGSPTALPGVRVIPIQAMQPAGMHHCSDAGFETIVSIPISQHDRLMGEVDLFFHNQFNLSDAERSLLEALTAHLAGAMENLRLNALEKEAAVSQERTFLARELHDSIAQSLAFLKIQVHLMRDALADGDAKQVEQALTEIDTGVRECYGDVRELLVHFRTRANAEDIEPALMTTLRKFEHQSGLKTTMQMEGHGLPLAPVLQVQVLHIVQEALSNVRKHARATQVWLDVQQQPQWRFEVRDDGEGFTPEDGPPDETHVGLRIMAERAERIGASLDVLSKRGRGTSVVLLLPPTSRTPPDQPALAEAALLR